MDRKSVPSNKEGRVTDGRSSSSSGASNLRTLRVQVACKGNGVERLTPVGRIELTLCLSRSYYKGIELGYLTEDPAAYHDPDVCAPYIGTS